MTLTDAQRNTIANALLTAARQYDKDAEAFLAGTADIAPDLPLAAMFEQQARECRELQERIDDAADVVLTD